MTAPSELTPSVDVWKRFLELEEERTELTFSKHLRFAIETIAREVRAEAMEECLQACAKLYAERNDRGELGRGITLCEQAIRALAQSNNAAQWQELPAAVVGAVNSASHHETQGNGYRRNVGETTPLAVGTTSTHPVCDGAPNAVQQPATAAAPDTDGWCLLDIEAIRAALAQSRKLGER